MTLRVQALWLGAVLLAAAPAAPAQAPLDGQVAVVSMERLFDDYHKTRAANARLKSRFETLETQRRDLMAQAKALKEALEAKGAAARDASLSDDERRRARQSAEEAFDAYRTADTRLSEFDADYKKQLGDQMKQTQQQLVSDIRAVIAAYVKERGIRIVLDCSGKTLNSVEAVVYHDPVLDITAPILAILNKHAIESPPVSAPAAPGNPTP